MLPWDKATARAQNSLGAGATHQLLAHVIAEAAANACADDPGCLLPICCFASITDFDFVRQLDACALLLNLAADDV
eukprot:SAG31_NODE_2891_length_4944_cov_2.014035_3_plen_76_part_00